MVELPRVLKASFAPSTTYDRRSIQSPLAAGGGDPLTNVSLLEKSKQNLLRDFVNPKLDVPDTDAALLGPARVASEQKNSELVVNALAIGSSGASGTAIVLRGRRDQHERVFTVSDSALRVRIRREVLAEFHDDIIDLSARREQGGSEDAASEVRIGNAAETLRALHDTISMGQSTARIGITRNRNLSIRSDA